VKVFVTGTGGQLGHDVYDELIKRGHTAYGEYVDITDRDAITKVIRDGSFDAVIHCAAKTSVDEAEDPGKTDLFYRTNAEGTRYIAKAVRETGGKMLYVSTDYVYDGSGDQPIDPDKAVTDPLNNYGLSKLKGENYVRDELEKFFIVRTQWVFGSNGNNFVKTMLRLGRDHSELSIVDDQMGTPTYTEDLSRLLADMVETERYGIYNASNSEDPVGRYISWADFAEKIFKIMGYGVKINRIKTSEYKGAKALRPLNTRLDKKKIADMGFDVLPSWEDALERYLNRSTGE